MISVIRQLLPGRVEIFSQELNNFLSINPKTTSIGINFRTAMRRQEILKGQVKRVFFASLCCGVRKKFYKAFFLHFANIFHEKTGLDCHRSCKNCYSWSNNNMTSHDVLLTFESHGGQ